MIVYSGYVRLMQEGALGHEADAYLPKDEDERRARADNPQRRRLIGTTLV